MSEKLMSITEYCGSRDMSRKSFYEHRRAGRLKGCFRKKPGGKRALVIPSKADRALTDNVRYNAGGAATKRKHAPGTVNGLESMWALHEPLSTVLGLKFDPQLLSQEFTEDQLQAHLTESVNLIFSALAAVARGDRPVKAALSAVLCALAAVFPPGEMGWDTERIDESINEIEKGG